MLSWRDSFWLFRIYQEKQPQVSCWVDGPGMSQCHQLLFSLLSWTVVSAAHLYIQRLIVWFWSGGCCVFKLCSAEMLWQSILQGDAVSTATSHSKISKLYFLSFRSREWTRVICQQARLEKRKPCLLIPWPWLFCVLISGHYVERVGAFFALRLCMWFVLKPLKNLPCWRQWTGLVERAVLYSLS